MSQVAKYKNTGFLHKRVLDKFLKDVLKVADFVRPKSILDLGCAEGFVMERIRTSSPGGEKIKFYGVDIDKQALDIAKKINPGARFDCLGVEDINKVKDSFDLVMMLEVLEHLVNYTEALEKISKLESGYFLFSVPHEPFFQTLNLLRGKYLSTAGNVPDHVNHWSKNKFKKLLNQYFVVEQDFSSFPWTMFLCKKIKQV